MTQATPSAVKFCHGERTQAAPPPADNTLVAVLDESGWRVANVASEDQAATLLAVASDDPSCWQDIVLLWPRYRWPHVPESAASADWAWKTSDFVGVQGALEETEHWLVMDLVHKRILTGKQFGGVEREQVYAMRIGEALKPEWPLSVHLPPWWELRESSEPSAVGDPTSCERAAPQPNRRVLFGSELISDLAQRILAIVHSPRWQRTAAADNPRERHALTVEVHRDWLLTGRSDLNGKTPRDMLHGGIEWHDALVVAQRRRYECGLPIVAVPREVSNLDTAPMGREEVCMYFDMCRELIAAGWSWAADVGNAQPAHDQTCHDRRYASLRQELFDRQAQWLQASFEDGSPPEFILECSRRRVPRGEGIEIVGMETRQSVAHIIDCECPVCQMMASGMFGACFNFIDGHHLELDEEFAFSLCQTHDEWQEEQQLLGIYCQEEE